MSFQVDSTTLHGHRGPEVEDESAPDQGDLDRFVACAAYWVGSGKEAGGTGAQVSRAGARSEANRPD